MATERKKQQDRERMQRNRAKASEVERQLRTALEGILSEKTISVDVGHGRLADVIRADSGAMVYARAVLGEDDAFVDRVISILNQGR